MSDQENKKVSQEDLTKAVESIKRLAQGDGEDVSKGHASRGTATTKVEAMGDGSVGAGSDQGSTQVYHTPQNSDPQGWAGSRASPEGDDGAHDNVSENGTDYNGVSHGLMKSIWDKISKGQPLSEAEQFVLKSVMEGSMSKAQDKDDKDDKDDEKDEDAQKSVNSQQSGQDTTQKSLTDHAKENEDVQKGLEVSQFLQGWVDTHEKALNSTESRINKSLEKIEEKQSGFNQELAKSISQLAEVMSLQSQRLEQIESSPARGPKSQTAAPVEKSFGPGGAGSQQNEGEQLTKSQALSVMTDMVQKSLLPATEVIKFESTGELTPEMRDKINAHRKGA